MDNKILQEREKEGLIGDKFINWRIFLIILGPITGSLSLFAVPEVVGSLISTNEDVATWMMMGGISTVGVGISLVMIGCTKNIIQKFEKHNL